MPVTLKCPECGREFQGKARFCRADGARLVEAGAEPAAATATAASAASGVTTPAVATAVSEKTGSGPHGEDGRPAGSAGPRRAAGAGAGSDPRRSSSRDIRPGAGPAGGSRGSSGRPNSLRGLPGVSGDDFGLPGGLSGEHRKARGTAGGARKDPRKESRRDHSGSLSSSALAPVTTGIGDKRSEAQRGDPMIGRTIAGRFQIEKVLGTGATGVVYRATHRALARKMAVKLLRPQFVWDDRSMERFFREARTYSLLDHPNIVYLYDFGRAEQGEPFLVMEYVEGQTLHEAIQRSPTRTLPLDRVLIVMSQVARALAHAHSRGVTHRDIKPENIMLVPQGEYEDLAKLLDFGVARVANSDRVTGVGQVTGTAEFIAPETLIDDAVIGPAVDVYAVGIIFHDALIGRPPFTGTLDVVLHQHIEVVPPLLSERSADPNLPIELDDVVARMLEKDPSRRPTAAELSEVLDRLLEEWLGREYAVDDASSISGVGVASAITAGEGLSAESLNAIGGISSANSLRVALSADNVGSVASASGGSSASRSGDTTDTSLRAVPPVEFSDLDTQPLALLQRETVMVNRTERKTEISDRLGRPTQVVARQDWPTRMMQAVGASVSARPTQVLPARSPRLQTQDQIDLAETHSAILHKTATDLATRLWPGGWPQALLNLQQHIDGCDAQERKLTTDIEAHEKRAREAPELLERHNELRLKVLGLSERLRSATSLDARERNRLADELESAERVFFTLEGKIQPQRRGNIEAQRQSRIDVRATRRRSRVMFARLLLAMPSPGHAEEAKRELADQLSRCEKPESAR
jgi:serine/threonine protein kinase